MKNHANHNIGTALRGCLFEKGNREACRFNLHSAADGDFYNLFVLTL